MRGTACGTAFTHTYILRLVTGILAYVLLGSLCFLVAFGSKHARYLEGKDYRESPIPQGYPATTNPYEPNPYSMNPQNGNIEFPYAYDSNAVISGYPDKL